MPKGTCSVDGCVKAAQKRGWCCKHYERWRRHGDPLGGGPEMPTVMRGASPEERFWAKVDKGGPVPAHRRDLGPCWIWIAGLSPKGYGDFRFPGMGHRAHRVAYELLIGPIPADLTLDHLCRNHACVNPAHLEPVPNRVNVLRGTGITAVNAVKTHCVHGHEFTVANTHIRPNGKRRCRRCEANRAKQSAST